MKEIVISGTGLYTPPEKISNEELVASFNKFVDSYNQQHQTEIAAGSLQPLLKSDVEFIIKASGIKSRYVMNKSGILNTAIMCPVIPERADEKISIQAEIAIAAAKDAMNNAKKTAADIDMVITSCTNMQRPYPAIAIEVQNALGIRGYGYDMTVACSSVTFGIQAAFAAIMANQAKCVLLLNPEFTTPQVDFRDRESHFIFGDVANALIIESTETCTAANAYEILSFKLQTEFSNNIRCNFGYINRAERAAGAPFMEKLFKQQGRKVFKEVVTMVENLILTHLKENKLAPADLKRLWLHQANININRLVATKVLGYEPAEIQAPIILDEYANTGSGGIAIAFHKYRNDLNIGDMGILCSFGAGYSIGNIILQKYS